MGLELCLNFYLGEETREETAALVGFSYPLRIWIPWRQSYVHCTHGHLPPVSLKTQIFNKTNALIWLQRTVLYQIIPSPAVA